MKALGKRIAVVFELLVIIVLILNTNQSPMVNATSAKTTINDITDTYVDAEQPDVNFGNSTFLLVSHFRTRFIRTWDQQTYISFNLKDFSCSSQAQFGVFTVSATNITVAIYQVNNPLWSESKVTWSNRPLYNSRIIDSTKIQNNTYTFFNVTNLVEVHQGGILGFALLATGNSSSNVYITSRESSNIQQIPEITCLSDTTTKNSKLTSGYTLLSLFIALPIVSKLKHKNK